MSLHTDSSDISAPTPHWTDAINDGVRLSTWCRAIGGNTPKSAQPRAHGANLWIMHVCFATRSSFLLISLWSGNHLSVYGIINWLVINKNRTPESLHVLHLSHELQQTFNSAYISCKRVSLLNHHYCTFSANPWLYFYVSQVIYGDITWAGKSHCFTPTCWVLHMKNAWLNNSVPFTFQLVIFPSLKEPQHILEWTCGEF